MSVIGGLNGIDLLKHCQIILKVSCTCLWYHQLWASLPHSSLYWEVIFFFFMLNRQLCNWFVLLWLPKILKVKHISLFLLCG